MTLPFELNEQNEESIRSLLQENCELLEEITDKRSEFSSDWFYRFIIRFLTSLDFSEEDAKQHYFSILQHRFELSEKTQRDVGIRVASLDYFINIFPRLKNPKIVEISLFEEILKMSKEDPKTGCFNAAFLHEFALKEFASAQRYEQQLSLILIDIDDFKALNDTHGHLFADKLLRKFADTLMKNARTEDIVSRFGGDEFALLLPHTGRIGARSLAERIKCSLLEAFEGKEYQGKPVRLTFSAGVATFPKDGIDYESIVREADSALYQAKRLGKNRIFDCLEKEYLKDRNKGKERREFSRYQLNSDLDVKLSNESGMLRVKGKVVDISMSGIMLECNVNMADSIAGYPVQIEIASTAAIPSNRLKANIVRKITESGRMKFYLGLRFEDILDDDSWSELERNGLISAK